MNHANSPEKGKMIIYCQDLSDILGVTFVYGRHKPQRK